MIYLSLPLGRNAATGNCRTTTKGLKARVSDIALFIYLNLQPHDVTAGRGANQPGSDVFPFFKRSHIAGLFIVLNNLITNDQKRINNKD